jgi:superoxide reductase
MADALQIYKCMVCGNIVEVFHGGPGELVCCGKPMKLFKENTVDAAKEKHVPTVEKTGAGIRVRVGAVPHPMTPDHYIEWIELLADGKIYRQSLKPGEPAEAFFCIVADRVTAREWCNLHGLWKGA